MNQRIQKNRVVSFRLAILGGLLTCLSLTTASFAQQGESFLQTPDEQELKLTGEFQLEQNTRKGYLVLTAKIPAGNYIYSLTQKGSPPPSKIEIATADTFRVQGTFKPEIQPTVVEKDPIFGGRVEKHKKSLRFFIPLELAERTSPEQLSIRLRFNGQMCSDDGTCMPIRNKIIEAQFSGYFQRVAQRNGESGNVRR